MAAGGFFPRKQSLTLYFVEGFDTLLAEPLARLGKHKTSKASLYINKLADVDVAVLEEVVRKGFIEAKKLGLTLRIMRVWKILCVV